MKYQAVIFDLFGTLIPNFSMEDYRQSVLAIANALAAPPDAFWKLWMELFEESINGFFASPEDKVAYICKKLETEANNVAIKEAVKARYAHESATMLPRPEATDVLRELKSRGLKIGLITDCSAEAVREWPKTSLASWFDVTIFSCLVKMKKPNPEIYKLALKQLEVKAEYCLYVGDGNSQELRGAKAVGLTTVLLKVPGEAQPGDFRDEQAKWADKIIPALIGILEIV